MNIIIASTSTVYGSGYLEYLKEVLEIHFESVKEIVFIPFARPSGISHDEYTSTANGFFKKIGKTCVGLHQFADPVSAIQQAEGLFTGGGNTFLLLKKLYETEVIDDLKKAIQTGIPYLGTSAGSNITGQTINNTNDMPIVYPPSFTSLGILPFNLNPHYLDPIPGLKHMGESRETRINEFLKQSEIPVLGLREGSYITHENGKFMLRGEHTARWFQAHEEPVELKSKQPIPC